MKQLHNQNILDIERFKNIKEPAISYFLGFLWADGHVQQKSNSINFTISSKDELEIFKFLKYSNLDFKYRKIKHPAYDHKEISLFRIVNFELKNFLLENDYKIKSTITPEKILSNIPENLKSYFYLGWLDGDGCIFSKKSYHIVHFTGTLNQDWNNLIKLSQNLNIKYRINKMVRKNRKSAGSYFMVCNYESCLKLLNYIYNNVDINNFGFLRKYNIFIKMKHDCITFIDTKKSGITKFMGKFKITAVDNGKRLSSKKFDSFDEAIKFKKILIKKYNTLEFRLRSLTNYWDFKKQFDNLQNVNPKVLNLQNKKH